MEKVDTRRLGSHLKRLREERKLTLGGVESLSEAVGERINKSYLFRVERGKTVPTIPRLRALAEVYRVKLSTLLELLEGAFEEQEREIDLGIDLSKLSFEELRDRGIEAGREGDFPKATLLCRAALDKALLEKPSPERSRRVAIARYELSLAFKNARRLDLAREEAEAALEEEGLPEDIVDQLLLDLAVIYRRLGRSFLSHELISRLLDRSGSISREVLAGAHSVMGSLLLKKNPRQAAMHYRSALSVYRRLKNRYEECKHLYNVGLAESNSRNFGRALRVLNKAREFARRKEYNFWLAAVQTEIGRTYYLSGDNKRSRAVLREASDFARPREYYNLLFLNQYYVRRIATEEGDISALKIAESSLKFFATRITGSFEELEDFKKELAVPKEKGL